MSDYGNPPNPYGQPGGAQSYGQPGGYPATGYGGYQPANVYAHWVKRVGATLIDGLIYAAAAIPAYVGSIISVGSVETTVDPATGMTTASGGSSPIGLLLIFLGLVLYLAVFVWNVCLKGGRTGYTIGKGVMGIKLIGEQTGQPIGAGMAFLRQLLHFVDSLPCYLGYLWPLWDPKRQTFADKILSTVVIEQPKD